MKRKPRCCQNEIAIIFLKPKVSLHCDELGGYGGLEGNGDTTAQVGEGRATLGGGKGGHELLG